MGSCATCRVVRCVGLTFMISFHVTTPWKTLSFSIRTSWYRALNITSNASARVVSGLTEAASGYMTSLTRTLAIVVETMVCSASSDAPM